MKNRVYADESNGVLVAGENEAQPLGQVGVGEMTEGCLSGVEPVKRREDGAGAHLLVGGQAREARLVGLE